MVFDFGYRLRELRERKHMTQLQAANRLSLSKTTISGYENNIKTPSLEILIKLARMYEVSADYILGFEDRRMLYVEDLTQEQQELLEAIIREFKRK